MKSIHGRTREILCRCKCCPEGSYHMLLSLNGIAHRMEWLCALLTDAMAYIFVFERNIIQLLSHGNRVAGCGREASEELAAADIAREPLRFAARLCMAAKEQRKRGVRETDPTSSVYIWPCQKVSV